MPQSPFTHHDQFQKYFGWIFNLFDPNGLGTCNWVIGLGDLELLVFSLSPERARRDYSFFTPARPASEITG